MMKLTFPRDRVLKLVGHTRMCKDHKTLYDRVTGPGLWLVGDEGVYLMSNGSERMVSEGDKTYVAYARESDPSRMSFDEYRAAKEASFGGSDGCEFLSMAEVEACLGTRGDFSILIDDDEMRLVKNGTRG